VATAAQWVSAARPRTLPAAISPVLVGTGIAVQLDGVSPATWARGALALVVALALQVAVNYANDYSDGIRGTDDVRVGPFRLTGSKAAAPQAVRRAAWTAFGLAALSGLVLVWVSATWWLIAVGAASILAAWYYTGGSRPYGYAGLGEVFVFVFFGLVAVLGTTYTQAGRVSLPALAGATAIGALACAILVANNLRDVPTDALAGKHTVAVRIGAPATRRLYTALVVAAFAAAAMVALRHPTVWLTAGAVAFAVGPVRSVLRGAEGRDLLPVLRDTGRLELAFAVLFGLGSALG